MGVERETEGRPSSVRQKTGSEAFVVDYFHALNGYPQKVENASDQEGGEEDEGEADGTVFRTRNLLPDQPHVVEALREGRVAKKSRGCALLPPTLRRCYLASFPSPGVWLSRFLI